MTTPKHGEVAFDWADGHYTFRLAIGHWRELRDKTGAGPHELFERVVRKRWYIDDLREVIRLGLIGGGQEPTDALKLVARYVDERPLLESVPVALQIMQASLIAPEDDQPKKGEGEAGTTAHSASPISTERLQ
jgi:hypothetical protein